MQTVAAEAPTEGDDGGARGKTRRQRPPYARP